MNTTTACIDAPAGTHGLDEEGCWVDSNNLRIQETDTKVLPYGYGEIEAGCWFEGARGSYIGEDVIETAVDHGFKVGELAPHARYSDDEFYLDLWTEAEDYMAQFADAGYWFGFQYGDWGLWPVDAENV